MSFQKIGKLNYSRKKNMQIRVIRCCDCGARINFINGKEFYVCSFCDAMVKVKGEPYIDLPNFLTPTIESEKVKK